MKRQSWWVSLEHRGGPFTDEKFQAMKALHKVDKSLVSPSRAQRAPTQQDLGNFLKPWMLGIISDMNDMLQDVQGRKSVSEKCQILRGLTALINNIGPTISNVAPQVSRRFFTLFSCL